MADAFDWRAVEVDDKLRVSWGLDSNRLPVEGRFDWETAMFEGRLNEEIWKQLPEAYEVAGEFMVKANSVVRDHNDLV